MQAQCKRSATGVVSTQRGEGEGEKISTYIEHMKIVCSLFPGSWGYWSIVCSNRLSLQVFTRTRHANHKEAKMLAKDFDLKLVYTKSMI